MEIGRYALELGAIWSWSRPRIDALLEARRQLNDTLEGDYKVSVNDFVVRATAIALRLVSTTDGKVLWVHEPEDKQAFRNPLDTSTLSTALTFLLGK